MRIHRTQSCGTYELHGIRGFVATPARSKQFIATFSRMCGEQARAWLYPGIVLFSDAKTQTRHGTTHGDRLAAYVRDKGLGIVTEGEWVNNPNTGNLIKYWMWHTNERAMERFLR